MGGGYPPIPLSFFGQNDFQLRGGREKSAKKQLFSVKNGDLIVILNERRMSQGVEIEGKNLIVFVVDDNKKQRVKRCYHQMLHLLTR